MPAAAVIPAPIACVKIVAVKKLVVGLLEAAVGPRPLLTSSFCKQFLAFTGCSGLRFYPMRKLECFRQARAGIR